MKKGIKPVYPEASVKEYTRLLQGLLKEFKAQALPWLQQLLKRYQDSALDDGFEILRRLWLSSVKELRDPIDDVLLRTNSRQLAWWVLNIQHATGLSEEAVRRFIVEPWLHDTHESRRNDILLGIEGVGLAYIASIKKTVNSAALSEQLFAAIQAEIELIFERFENKLIFHARNEIEEHYATLNQLRQQDSGGDSYEWLETVSYNPRESHLKRVGKIFRWDSPPDGGHPGTEPNCKCGARTIFGSTIYGIPIS